VGPGRDEEGVEVVVAPVQRLVPGPEFQVDLHAPLGGKDLRREDHVISCEPGLHGLPVHRDAPDAGPRLREIEDQGPLAGIGAVQADPDGSLHRLGSRLGNREADVVPEVRDGLCSMGGEGGRDALLDEGVRRVHARRGEPEAPR